MRDRINALLEVFGLWAGEWKTARVNIERAKAVIHGINPWYYWRMRIMAILGTIFWTGLYGAVGLFVDYLLREIIEKGRLTPTMIVIGCIGTFAYRMFGNLGEVVGKKQESLVLFEYVRSVRERIHEKMASLDFARLFDPQFLHLQQSVISYNKAEFNLWASYVNLGGALMNAVAGLVALGMDQPTLLPFGILPAVGVFLAVQMFEVDRDMIEREQVNHEHMSVAHRSWLQESARVIRARILGITQFLRDRGHYYDEQLEASQEALEEHDRKTNFWIDTCCDLASVAGLAYIGWLCLRGDVSGGEAVFLGFTVAAANERVGSLGEILQELLHENQHYELFEKLMATEPKVQEAHAVPLELDGAPRLECVETRFAYHDGGPNALNACSVQIPAGSLAALIGPNGSGKTTLLMVASHLISAQQGEVLIEDIPARKVTEASVLAHTAIMPVQAALPEMLPLDEAIAGCPRSKIHKRRFAWALRASGAKEVINSLPHRMDTCLDLMLENGQSLSAGQLRRLCMAATLYRLQRPEVTIGLFDEPTANVDAETRELFFVALKEFEGRKTIIVATHDDKALRHFKLAFLMEQGRVTRMLRGQQIRQFSRAIASKLALDN